MRGQIAGDGDPAGQLGQPAGQQAALEHVDEFVLGVEGVGAHQGLPDEARGGGEQGAFLGAEVVRRVPADQARPGHPALGGQRQDGEAAGADVGEAGFEDGAGGPEAGRGPRAARPGQGGQGAHRRVGPLACATPGATARARHSGSGGSRTVTTSRSFSSSARAIRSAPSGSRRAATTARLTSRTVAGDGERGGQPLHAGDVVDAGAQVEASATMPSELCGSAVAAGSTRPRSLSQRGSPVGLADPELQLTVAEWTCGPASTSDISEGRSSGTVQAEQGLDLAVEVVRGDAEQLEQGAVRLDPAGVRGAGRRSRRAGSAGRDPAAVQSRRVRASAGRSAVTASA